MEEIIASLDYIGIPLEGEWTLAEKSFALKAYFRAVATMVEVEEKGHANVEDFIGDMLVSARYSDLIGVEKLAAEKNAGGAFSINKTDPAKVQLRASEVAVLINSLPGLPQRKLLLANYFETVVGFILPPKHFFPFFINF